MTMLGLHEWHEWREGVAMCHAFELHCVLLGHTV